MSRIRLPARAGLLFAALSLAGLLLQACRPAGKKEARVLELAANEEVREYLRNFEGRGALSDDSRPTPPEEALSRFLYPQDLRLDLVLAEPLLSQPVFMNFDHRGRLWVVQYNQYPYPEGLKITGIDNHLRLSFDTVPLPPPQGQPGADKITVFEDTDGNGSYDKATDVITGLNIATSVTLGRGKIWVLSPPYLLAYPDPNGDGVPEGNPEVHLRGFGLEDTHAVANSLRWGPDGWLYGAQGSTTTASVSSAATRTVSFSGQAIWRYHPETRVFELFAEGGGNTFYVEIDDKGRIYSGDNGVDRGQYYKQGAYYIKNWGKHGALTNEYAFGHLPNMALEGDKVRFTHAWIRYGGGSLPPRYDDAMIAVNPLQGYLQLSRFQASGSTFRNIDEAIILETEDRWFRPVDIKTGPDGAVYIADWYDSRLSHVDPRDTWHKSSGRIYRLHSGGQVLASFDLSACTGEELISLLSHKNRWFRQQALIQFGDRKDASLLPELRALLRRGPGQTALEALWAIHLSGGFDEATARETLSHADPFVRMWAVRLLGDARKVSPELSGRLASLASGETHPEVRSQLASSARRLPARDALPIIKNLLMHHNDAADPDIPLLIWWALESKAETDREEVLAFFGDPGVWKRPLVRQVLLERIMQRYAMAKDLEACASLLRKAPSPELGNALVRGLQEGLRGTGAATLPPGLAEALKPYQTTFGEESAGLAIRQGDQKVLDRGLKVIADEKASPGERLSYIRIMGEVRPPEALPVLLSLLPRSNSEVVLQAALQSLQSYDGAEIGRKVLDSYPDKLRAYPAVRDAALSLFASRPSWAALFIEAIKDSRRINPADVPPQIALRFQMLDDPAVSEAAERLWPEIRIASASEKNREIARIVKLLKSGQGNAESGQALFSARCGSCHRLFGQGGEIGPDLSGYERSNIDELLLNTVDPNAYIREGYVYYNIRTTDGRHLTGKILERRGNTLTIQPLAGDKISLASGQIAEMEAQSSSVMPERLLQGLNDQQIRDLFAYLGKPAND